MPSADPTATPRDLAVVLHDLAWLLPRTVGAAAMRAEPLPPTALEVMRVLSRRAGQSVNDVAAEIGVAANNVSSAVTLLEAQGLVERHRDPADGRVTRMRLTERALVARQAREQTWGQGMARALEGLGPEDRAVLLGAVDVLGRLADELSGESGTPPR